MQIVDLTSEHLEAFFHCLVPDGAEAKLGRTRKAAWYEYMKSRGLVVKLALEGGAAVGMVQAVPIEHSPAVGRGHYFVLCIWVRKVKDALGNHQGKGIGTALLAAVEEEARRRGAPGLVVWGLALPFFMRARWFEKHDYEPVDRDGMAVLLWKRFADGAERPRWMHEHKPVPQVPGQTTVTCFANGWCAFQNVAAERAKAVAAELGDKVVYREISCLEPEAIREWGRSDDIFVGERLVSRGPPPTEAKLRRVMVRAAYGPWWKRGWQALRRRGAQST
jgi:GNAT superfamily N-acetyltransferase